MSNIGNTGLSIFGGATYGGNATITAPTPGDPYAAAAAGAAANDAAASSTTPAQSSARAIVQQMLDQWGLGQLAGMAWGLITQNASTDEVAYQLRQTDEYKQRFAGNIARQKNGQRPLTEAEYISNEESYQQAARQYLGPLGDQMYGKSDYANWIAGGVSPQELANRLQQRAAYVAAAPEDQRAFMAYNGVSQDMAVAAFTDPNRALPLIQRQLDEAQLGGAAQRAGLNLTAGQASHLAEIGVSLGDATTGFTHLAAAQQLLSPLPGEAGPAISQDEALAGTLEGNADAAQKLSRRQQARQAAFQDGGGFASGQGGLAGLGVAR